MQEPWKWLPTLQGSHRLGKWARHEAGDSGSDPATSPSTLAASRNVLHGWRNEAQLTGHGWPGEGTLSAGVKMKIGGCRKGSVYCSTNTIRELHTDCTRLTKKVLNKKNIQQCALSTKII